MWAWMKEEEEEPQNCQHGSFEEVAQVLTELESPAVAEETGDAESRPGKRHDFSAENRVDSPAVWA